MNDLINQTKSEIGKTDCNAKREESSAFINLVFHNLKLIFPAWRQNFKTENEFNLTKSLWLETLIDENITTQEQIQRALKCARNHDSAFFPSIGQFVKWSKKTASRVNEQAYKLHVPAIQPHTKDEYIKMAESGRERIKKESGV